MMMVHAVNDNELCCGNIGGSCDAIKLASNEDRPPSMMSWLAPGWHRRASWWGGAGWRVEAPPASSPHKKTPRALWRGLKQYFLGGSGRGLNSPGGRVGVLSGTGALGWLWVC
jgi:hypothetical protein